MLSWLLACLTIVASQAIPSYYVCTEKNIDYYGLEPLAFPTKWTKISDSSYHPLCSPFDAHEFKDKPVWVGFYATCNFKSFTADSLKLTKVPSAHVKDPSIPLPIEQTSGIYQAFTDHPYISKYIACVHRNAYTTNPPTSILSQYINRIKKIRPPTSPPELLPTLKPEPKPKHVSFTLPNTYMRSITSKERVFTLQEKKKFKASQIPTLNLKLQSKKVNQAAPKNQVAPKKVPIKKVPPKKVPPKKVPPKKVPPKKVPTKKVPTKKIHQKTKHDAFAVFRAKRLIQLHNVYKKTQKQLQHIDIEIQRAKSFNQQYVIQKRKDRLNKLLLRVKKEYLDLY